MTDNELYYRSPHGELYCGDSLILMQELPDNSIDLILSDPPFGTTQNSWDTVRDFNKMWEQYKRIIKPNGCIAIFAQAPFSHVLACSNMDWYRYEWVIEKTKATGHLNAKKMPMKAHENVIIFGPPENDVFGLPEESPDTLQIFYKKLPTYNPQMSEGHPPVHNYTKHTSDGSNYGASKIGISGGGSTTRYPRDVLRYKWDTQKSSIHPCQKPVELLEDIIKTYTNAGDTVLDDCMGSCSTGVAAVNTERYFIGYELEKDIYKKAKQRFTDTVGNLEKG